MLALDYHRFKQQFQKFSIPLDAPKFAVAVSGGSDSLALALLMNSFTKENGGKLICITFDHRLRAESKKEAQKIHRRLKKMGIQHFILTYKGTGYNTRIQENAREARYQALDHFCYKKGINYLLTGHQKGDNLETYLIRKNKKSQNYGLAGLSAKILLDHTILLRPLLTFSKEEIQNFLKAQNMSWIEDPSNRNTKFARVRARKELNNISQVQQNALQREIIANTLARQGLEQDIVLMLFEALFYFDSRGIVYLDCAKILQASKTLKGLFFANLLATIGGKYYPISFNKIIKHLKFLDKGQNFSLGNCLIYYKYINNIKYIVIHKEVRKQHISFKRKFMWNNFYVYNIYSPIFYVAKTKNTNLKYPVNKKFFFSVPCFYFIFYKKYCCHIKYLLLYKAHRSFLKSFFKGV